MMLDIKPRAIVLFMIGDKKIDYYNGILIKSDRGLHSQILSIINSIFKDRKEIRILDIASGEGALTYRIYQEGFQNIEAVDINSPEFKLHDFVFFTELNLNDLSAFEQFSQNNFNSFDLILGIETIEHLENPWLYIRCLKKMLSNEGIMIISTPNINSIYSKIRFFSKDRFFQFSEEDLKYFHINPISVFELQTICQQTNLTIMNILPGGLYPIIWITRNPLFSILYSLSNILFFPFSSGQIYGWCNIFIISKTKVKDNINLQ